MIRRACDRDQKAGRLQISNVSTAIHGLMEMDGDIHSLKRGILLLNIKLTFFAARSALRRFLRSIRRNMWGRSE